MTALSTQFYDQDKNKLHRIADWLEKLSKYTLINDKRITKDNFAELTLMLSIKFPAGAFCLDSLMHIAENRKFFPIFAELCSDLKEWLQAEKNRRDLANVDTSEFETDVFRCLPLVDQAMVKIFRTNQAKQWIEPEETSPPSIELQNVREKRSKKVLHDLFPNAWKYLFKKKEAETQGKYLSHS